MNHQNKKDISAESKPLQKQSDGWIKRKYNYFTQAIKSLLTAGMSPQKISFALAIGFAIGTFPILGTHTILGIFIAMLLGLNQVAVYLGAWLSAPAYVLLLLPSLRTGEFLLKSENMDLDKFITNLKRMFHSFHDFTEVGVIYGQSIVHIIIGWLPYAIVLSFLMYFISLSFARLLMKKKNN